MSEAMIQAIIWLAVFLAIVLSLWAIVRENDRRSRRTVQQWEQDFAAGQGKLTQFIQAGALGLEGILDEKRSAIEYKQDEQQGQTKTGSKGDDEDRTAVATDGEN